MNAPPKPLVIFGAGDFAQVAHFYFTQDSPRQVEAFCVNEQFLKTATFLDRPLVAFETLERTYPPERYDLFIAIGYHRLNEDRALKYEQAKAKGYRLASYMSSRSVVWPGLKVGDNCFILENQTIQPFVEIGNDVILWSGNHIGHHSRIEDHVFVSSHVVVCSRVNLGAYSFLGVNATIGNNVRLGRRTVAGAGAVILHDSEENAVYASRESPVRSRQAGRSAFFGKSSGQ